MLQWVVAQYASVEVSASGFEVRPVQTPHEKTLEEVRDAFLDQVWVLINWWETEGRVPDVGEKLQGLAHSILVLIDGGGALPPFVLAPDPHPDDREFWKELGEDWYPETPEVATDIGGSLHEFFHQRPAAKRAAAKRKL